LFELGVGEAFNVVADKEAEVSQLGKMELRLEFVEELLGFVSEGGAFLDVKATEHVLMLWRKGVSWASLGQRDLSIMGWALRGGPGGGRVSLWPEKR